LRDRLAHVLRSLIDLQAGDLGIEPRDPVVGVVVHVENREPRAQEGLEAVAVKGAVIDLLCLGIENRTSHLGPPLRGFAADLGKQAGTRAAFGLDRALQLLPTEEQIEVGLVGEAKGGLERETLGRKERTEEKEEGQSERPVPGLVEGSSSHEQRTQDCRGPRLSQARSHVCPRCRETRSSFILAPA